MTDQQAKEFLARANRLAGMISEHLLKSTTPAGTKLVIARGKAAIKVLTLSDLTAVIVKVLALAEQPAPKTELEGGDRVRFSHSYIVGTMKANEQSRRAEARGTVLRPGGKDRLLVKLDGCSIPRLFNRQDLILDPSHEVKDTLREELLAALRPALDSSSGIELLDRLIHIVQSALSSGHVPINNTDWFKIQPAPSVQRPEQGVVTLLPAMVRMADLCSSHLTKTDMWLLISGSLRYVSYIDNDPDRGVIVRLPFEVSSLVEDRASFHDACATLGMSVEFRNFMEAAMRQNFTHVIIDRDGAGYDIH